jgi:hypothetical protein
MHAGVRVFRKVQHLKKVKKNLPQPLFLSRSTHACQQNFNPSRDPVLLKRQETVGAGLTSSCANGSENEDIYCQMRTPFFADMTIISLLG